ncbi:hydroxymethylpyrimidine kinase/phosphomethylpyrimidine kinase [Allocatelliglobosispora scoriae]|uniref:Hydroxymethylpyrimidine kinase/phosphomethylpyrimidine kinase n=1 Tax=Allocatelliglobosispora scoriae TaxID=643052 RepID=A0A841BTH2_9ACTN|nr:bifunctional hydroxymethylpyrimidine kinase/phosphomethylpyrimidine kinase [Allocatelliglobosispora scoriae]MBB5871504.1 hydroxymethylpyrimidine kinase/phosphomethylpyrimidine kinase [Allocatelliglobosispora scoriae]
MTPPVALTIAGSDASGGAGIQADLKVFVAYGCYGASVITALTAQNTLGVHDVFAVPGAVVGTQLAAVLDDLPVAAAKVGMLGSSEAAAQVAARARNGAFKHLVIDPVLVSSTGQRLGVRGAIERLLPYATVVTPNREEASALLGWRVETPNDMAGAAAQLSNSNSTYVVITGGDLGGPDSVDAIWTPKGAQFLRSRRVNTRNNHGTGCTFSAAITAMLARGETVDNAVRRAKDYVSRALAGAMDWKLGAGPGPLDHNEWGPS